jgi:DNA polymerase-1
MIDPDHFANMERILTEDMDSIIEKVRSDTGYYCNLGSGDQVSELLFNKLGLKPAKSKPTPGGGRESVAFEALVGIQHQHPTVSDCIEYKEIEKLRGTYARPIPKLAKRVRFGEYRLYPNLGTTRIPSGRLNCKEPNLLAIPNRTDRAKLLCKGFITKPGWVLISVDESQIEPRIVAHRSKDQGLIDIYNNQEDIYSDFAIAAFKLPDKRYRDKNGKWKYPGVDKDRHRFPSKTCTLASLYEVSGLGLSEQMPVVCNNCNKQSKDHDNKTCKSFSSLWTEDRCQDLINSFYMKYQNVLKMRMKDHHIAKKHALIWDDWGRILHVQAVRSILPWVVSSALRQAGNFPIQSTAQGTIKIAMSKIQQELTEWRVMGELYNPLLQIHDEILGEVREDYAEEIGTYKKDVFENTVRLIVPIKAEYATSMTWGELVK